MTDAAREALQALTQQMAKAVIGQQDILRSLLISLLCNGNVLLEGLPGTAKTRSIRTLAEGLGVNLGRIQFTPDLLPADITGSEVYREHEGHGVLTFERGPVFNELVLADEINRAPAKVQSALLEAMEERQVTVAGKTYPLPSLFLVLATQNAVEMEGTYPLPEAQLDRFLFKLIVPRPDPATLVDVLDATTGDVEADPAAVLATTTSESVAAPASLGAKRTVRVRDSPGSSPNDPVSRPNGSPRPSRPISTASAPSLVTVTVRVARAFRRARDAVVVLYGELEAGQNRRPGRVVRRERQFDAVPLGRREPGHRFRPGAVERDGVRPLAVVVDDDRTDGAAVAGQAGGFERERRRRAWVGNDASVGRELAAEPLVAGR